MIRTTVLRSFPARLAPRSFAAATKVGNVRCADPFLSWIAPDTTRVSKSSITGIPNRSLPQRTFSSSHDDFAPQPKAAVPESEEKVHAMIKRHVDENPIMLYMKGNPQQPMCGFSATVVAILKEYDVDYGSVNVLDYPSIRNGIKTFSNWPTIPQLYVLGEFIGGSDIVKEMHASGELRSILRPARQAMEEKDAKK
jgi:monothiol glutaredoxin